MASAVRQHFDQQSGAYTKSSGSFLWRWQRGRETAAVDALLGPVSGEDILDLGCGSGYYTRHFLRNGARHVTAVDFSPSMVSQLPKTGVTGIVGDAATLRLQMKFPKIICAGLLEFVPSAEAVLRQARDLITDRGSMVCLLPPDNWASGLYRSYHRRHGIEISLFKHPQFKKLCDETGWEIDAHKSVFPYSNLYRLSPRPVR
jgi:SAM-dependent methyltransferase